MRRASVGLILLCFVIASGQAFAAVIYQDFEPGNETPSRPNGPEGSPPEYGWGFNEAVVSLSLDGEPVHSGLHSWKATIPSGEPVHAGTGVPSQVQTYDMNFLPDCHDRFSFWIWSDPSTPGDHTVMVKFFDRSAYKDRGIGIWTKEKARGRQWTPLEVFFNELPQDFDLRHVDKVEFFTYWDGTYYFDDLQVRSAANPLQDVECLQERQVIVCQPCHTAQPDSSADEAATHSSPALPPGFCGQPLQGYERAVIGLADRTDRRCVAIYGQHAELMAQYGETQTARRLEMIKELGAGDPR